MINTYIIDDLQNHHEIIRSKLRQFKIENCRITSPWYQAIGIICVIFIAYSNHMTHLTELM